MVASSPATAVGAQRLPRASAAGLHISGPESSTVQSLRRTRCASVSERDLNDIGVYQRGLDTWLLMASAYVVPSSAQAPVLSARSWNSSIKLRASGARCGERSFGPAPPVNFPALLAGVAYDHALDMANTAISSIRIWPGTRPPIGSVQPAIARSWLGKTSRTARKPLMRSCKAGWTVPATAKTSWMPASGKWASLLLPARPPNEGLYWVQVLAAPAA
jgi:hypothetical protein